MCPICQELAELVADRCHASGAIREWICRRCNAGLGFFRDRPESLRRAADYLEKHRANPLTTTELVRNEHRRFTIRTAQRRARRLLLE